MREIFEDAWKNEPLDPTEAARRALRPKLRERFYRAAEARAHDDGFVIVLDGRPVRTPARKALAFPVRDLAEAAASEWAAQKDAIDPFSMPLTRLANAIIDGVVDNPAPVAQEIEKFLGTDLLYYRAARPPGLVARQSEAWDPVLAWARASLGAQFILSEGIVFVEQPEQALMRARTAVPADPWRLGAVHAMTTLTGSALLALAVAAERLSVGEAWEAAHVDEDWNMERWGEDPLVLERRAFRWAEMQAAGKVVACVRRAQPTSNVAS